MKLTSHLRSLRPALGIACSILLIIGSLPLAPFFTVQAFFPTNLLTVGGIFGKSHQKMTEEAVTELDQDFFGVSRLTKSMKKAKEQIADANSEVDDAFPNDATRHFDGERLPEAQAQVIDRLNGVIAALEQNNAESARVELGSALHTIQDFYSHSNWVELGNGSPHPGLGRPGSSLSRLPATTPTCQECTGGLPPILCPDCSTNLITSGLTSGYYGGQDAPVDVKPPGKCSHGGALDSSATGLFGQGINKDSIDCEFSPHNFLHAQAAAVAKEATKQFIRDIKDRVTPRQLKLLLGVGPTLAIAIDTTGSMGSIINGVKQQAIQIVNSRLGTDEEPSKYVLSAFSDPGVGPLTVTTDADQFKSAINALSAGGGGDCPELSQSGMLRAIAASDKGGDLFMFTDASAKDSGLAGTVSALATTKDIRIYPILFGSCSPIDPSYIRVANDSGGQLFFLSTSEAGSITQLADFIVRSNVVNLLLIGDTLSGTARTYTVPVDSTMTRATFSVSGGSSVAVTRPGGATVLPTDPGVSILSLTGGKIYSIATPVTGEWRVTVNGAGEFSVKVSGESSLDLASFRFVRLGGRSGHQGFFPIDGLPLAGEESTVDAVISGDFGTIQFDLRSRNGSALQTLNLAPVPGTTDEFSGRITPPNSPFLIYATGLNSAGHSYQRVLSASIRPQTVEIQAPPSQDLRPGQTSTFTFKVTNLGGADTFRFAASDDKSFLIGVSPTTFALNNNESRDVTVELKPPVGATAGISDTLTVTVDSTSPSGASNFAVVTNFVVPQVLIPKITSVSPAQGLRGQTVAVTVTGENTNFVNGVTAITFSGAGITVNSTTVNSPISATANISIGLGAAVTLRDVTVTTGTETATATAAFQVLNAAPVCSNARPSVALITPPNRAMVPVSLTGVTDPENDPVTLRVTSVRQDEPVDHTGDGSFAPDAAITGATVSLRAESILGTVVVGGSTFVGNGRFYQVGFTATDSFNQSCNGTVLVGVPHVRTASPINDGSLFDSTSSTASSNPLDTADARFFVQQHYYDFLNREPDLGGLEYWAARISECGTDQACVRTRRVDVSNAFFYEQEYQKTGAYVFRLYRASYGNTQPFPNPFVDTNYPNEDRKLPAYDPFSRDHLRVVGGASLRAGQQDLANDFVVRPEFLARYAPGLDGPGFVDAILITLRNDLGVDLSTQRTALIDLFNSGGRAAVMYRLADDNSADNPINNRVLLDAEYNRSFVYSQYAGYLRRDSDIGGFQFWLRQVNSGSLRDANVQHALVCSFITSAEYQRRFSPLVTRSNQECDGWLVRSSPLFKIFQPERWNISSLDLIARASLEKPVTVSGGRRPESSAP